jgi:hypothetical protein
MGYNFMTFRVVLVQEKPSKKRKALKGHISFMLADGDEIPTPSTLETILTDADHQDAIAFLLIEVSVVP